MNHEKIDRFDTDYFKNLDEINKERYFISFVRKTLNKMEKGGDKNDNRL